MSGTPQADGGPLRVGIDMRTFTPRAGQARYLWRLGGWLSGRGHDVHFPCVRRTADDAGSATEPPGTTLHPLKGVPRRTLRSYVTELELDVLLVNPERCRHFRGMGANLLRPGYGTDHYRQKLASFRTLPGRAARRLLRLMPWVVAERRWERAFYEDTEPPPDVVANSRYMRGEVLDTYEIPAERVHVVHNGVDLSEFSPEERARMRPEGRTRWRIPEDATCLLFMGHNFRLKGLWQILELVARLRREEPAADLRLLVAGSGVGRGQVRKARRIVAGLGLEESVHLLGPVRPAMRALAAADVFVHLSWHDSFGFVVLEAMAAGLPVVTTPLTGASELMEDGKSGVLVHPGDPGEVLEGLRSLVDPEARRRVGADAAEVAARYPEERNFRAVLELMRLAAERTPGTVG